MDTEIIKIMLAFMVLINPLGALTLFLTLTQGYSEKERVLVARIASVTVFFAIAFCTLLGEKLLRGLGISIGAFQLAGGILVLLIALNMVNGNGNTAKPKAENVEMVQALSPSAVAVVPIAIPMMVGPGGISTIIIYAARANSTTQLMMIVLAGLFISILCYLGLMAAGRISRFLGDSGVMILSRIMGILLAAVAVEIFLSGLRKVFPMLA